MNIPNSLRSYVFILVITAGMVLVGCDDSSQNIGWRPGDTLDIVGASQVVLTESDATVTEDYFVRAFTIEKNYTWAVSRDGESLDNFEVRREGEFIDVVYDEPGLYSITVDNGEYQGELQVAVTQDDD